MRKITRGRDRYAIAIRSRGSRDDETTDLADVAANIGKN
jgi:hypothetical protein